MMMMMMMMMTKNSNKEIQWRRDVLPQVKVVLEQFKKNGVDRPTLRAVYYKLYSMGVISENSIKMYRGLITMLKVVRMEGSDPQVQPYSFSDESRNSVEMKEIESLEDWLDRMIRWAEMTITGEDEYVLHKWYNQPYYVEAWIEKQAMYSTFESILKTDR
jgi:hypothetical protein